MKQAIFIGGRMRGEHLVVGNWQFPKNLEGLIWFSISTLDSRETFKVYQQYELKGDVIIANSKLPTHNNVPLITTNATLK